MISLLVLILMDPLLARGHSSRLLLGVLTFVPLIVATIRMSHRRAMVWGFSLLMTVAAISGTAAVSFGNQKLFTVQWAILTVAFGLAVGGMFSYLQRASSISAGDLYAAASIYFLLAMSFYALYSAIAAIHPEAFQSATGGSLRYPDDLLYFSLVTLSTVGYGDIVAVGGLTRMLAGLEGATGVLYVAITVALLVSAYKGPVR